MAPYTDAFWVFDETNTPCRCCSAIDAMEDGFWNCKERRWVVVDTYFPLEHSAETCDGSCGNPFHAEFISELLCGELTGTGWGDVVMEWEQDEYLQLTPEQKAARYAAELAEKAEKERLAPLLAEHHAQVDRMRRCRIIAKEKKNQGRKEAAPCRSLYDYQREGGCQSLSVCTECWAHEFTDSLTSEIVDEQTGQFKPMADKLYIRQAMTDKECGVFRVNGKFVLKWMPHVCYMSHPGEATWNPEWKTNRLAGRDSRPRRDDGPRGPRRDDTQSHGRHHDGKELLHNWRGDKSTTTPTQPVSHPPTNRFANLDSSW